MTNNVNGTTRISPSIFRRRNLHAPRWCVELWRSIWRFPRSYFVIPCILGLLNGCEQPTSPGGLSRTSTKDPNSASAPNSPLPPMVQKANADKPVPPIGATPVDGPRTGKTNASASLLDVHLDLRTVNIEALKSRVEIAVPPLVVSAEISDAPLRAVLEELSRKTGVKIYTAGPLPEKTISVSFDSLSIEEAIQRILQGINYTLTRRKLENPGNLSKDNKYAGEVAPLEIHILPNGLESTGKQVATEEPMEVNATAQAAEVATLAERALNAQNADARMAALRTFLERAESSEHVSVLVRALKDADPHIREFALFSLGDEADPPFDAIAEVATSDSSLTLRKAALSTLVSNYGAMAASTLQQANSDPDPEVQKAAQLSLKMLEQAQAELDAVINQVKTK